MLLPLSHTLFSRAPSPGRARAQVGGDAVDALRRQLGGMDLFGTLEHHHPGLARGSTVSTQAMPNAMTAVAMARLLQPHPHMSLPGGGPPVGAASSTPARRYRDPRAHTMQQRETDEAAEESGDEATARELLAEQASSRAGGLSNHMRLADDGREDGLPMSAAMASAPAQADVEAGVGAGAVGATEGSAPSEDPSSSSSLSAALPAYPNPYGNNTQGEKRRTPIHPSLGSCPLSLSPSPASLSLSLSLPLSPSLSLS